MLRFLKSLYLRQRFFYVVFGTAVLFLLSYWWQVIYPFIWLGVLAFGLIFLADVIALYRKSSFTGARNLPDKFSNSDQNEVLLTFENAYRFKVSVEIIDELPKQFQKRDFNKILQITNGEKSKFEYFLRPVERGEYHFGKLNCYVSSPINLIKRRYIFSDEQMVKVYPSFVQMKKYDFLAIDNRMTQLGLKKIRRIGHTMEFEQIKEYVPGDDIRTINWKATAKRGDVMINQFQDEKSQPIYSIIDVSRVMKMPFDGLKLVDYAINSTLAFSNIALKKKDRVGMMTFSEKVKDMLPAKGKKTHLNLMLKTLYNIDTRFLDSDFGSVYAYLKRQVSHRSLLMLYTNFEHISSLKRQLPYLKAIARKHVLVVIFFENTELTELIEKPTDKIDEVYEKTIAAQFQYDKKVMVNELEKNGIQAVLTAPENLTVNTINKYLELKSKGLV